MLHFVFYGKKCIIKLGEEVEFDGRVNSFIRFVLLLAMVEQLIF